MFDVLWDALPAIGTVAAWVVTISLLDTWVCRNLGAVFAGASDFVFCGWCSLADAEAGLGGGVVDLCGARRFADFISGV